MDEEGAMLGVGFAIDFHDSFGQLRSLDDLIGTVQANAVREFQKLEAAAKGSLDLKGATARVSTFGNATTREAASAASALIRVEKAGEGLSRQLERQAGAFGKTKDQLRLMKVESAALAAEQQGLTELAMRLRSQEAALRASEVAAAEQAAAARIAAAQRAADAEVEATRRATAALAEQARLRAAIERNTGVGRTSAIEGGASYSALAEQTREMERLAAAAAHLKASIDPAIAAQQRFDAEIANARNLVSAGAITLDDYVAKLQMERAALASVNTVQDRAIVSTGAHRQAMQGLSFQAQDAFTQISMGTNVLTVLAIQGGQAAGQMAGLEGTLGAAARFMLGPWGLAVTAAMLVLGSLSDKIFKSNNALGDAIDKLKEDAKQSEISRQAKEAFGRTLEGLIEIQREFNEELKRGLQTQQQIEVSQLNTARTQLRDFEKKRDELQASIAKQQGLIKSAKGNVGLAAGVEELEFTLRDMKAQLAAANKGIAAARIGIREATIPIMDRAVEGALDKVVEATNRFEAAQGRLRAEYAAGTITRRAYGAELAREKAQLEAVTKAEQARQSAAKASDGVSRFKSREQAIGIAGRELQSAGMRVDGNVQFGVTTGHANDAAHNRYAIDVNVGKGITEANVPNLKAKYDELARLYQSRGYDVIWNKQFYAAGGKGPTSGAKGHQDHLHIQAPATVVGKTTQASTARQQLGEFRSAMRETTDAEAIQAQTQNLYALAKAYEASGGAALIAAVRVKAESEAIRDGADIEANVSREVGLAIAQRVADAARSTASVREQAAVQEQVNAQVAAGLIPAERAADLVRDQMTDLPLLAAIQAAQQQGLTADADRATKALEDQRAARKSLTEAEKKAADQQQATQIDRSTAGALREAEMVKKFGTQRIAALKGLSRQPLEDQLAAINVEQEKSAILLRAQAEAADLLKRGLDGSAAAVLRQAQAEIDLVDLKAKFDRETVAIERYNDQLRDTINLLEGMGTVGQGLGALLGIVSGNTASVRGPIGQLLNTSFDTGKTDKSGAKIASTIGDEVSKVFGKGGKFGEGMKSALQGAGVGMGTAEAVFGKQSTVQKLGSAIGGMAGKALGTAIAGPLGGAIGSIAGGLLGSVVGGLFTKAKWGRVDLSSSGVSATSGNSSAAEKAALAAGKSIFGSLTNLAQQLGGSIGDFGNISVGTRHGDYRVNTGGTSLKVKGGAVDFNDDAEAAVAYAIKQAIERGAITGIRQSTNNLLKAGDDLQAQLQKAMNFEAVFTDLKGYTDPVGASLDAVNKQFGQLRAIFKEAGASAAEYASLEQLLTIKRQEAMRKESDALDDVRSRIAEARGDDATVKAIDRAHELRDALNDNVRAELKRLYAVEDSVAAQQKLTEAQQAATAAADELRNAWKSIGTDLLDEINRIRGITDATGSGGFAALQGRFNAAVDAARGGDKDAAGKLVDLSQALLTAAGNTATSKQELDRIKAQTAASLEGVYGLVGAMTGAPVTSSTASTLRLAATSSQATSGASAANDNSAFELRALRQELAQMRADMNSGLAVNANASGRSAKVLETALDNGGGEGLAVNGVAA
ncbi:hypothetical protein [uncultured Novosphingobium sp.]|uniref:hypothetical protein n=1 Tax=uncultured Novosphingobium sp. TaxID=292277 RepID=UPI00374979BE